MGKFSVSHTIDCDAERFWKVFLDKAFNEHLYREALGFPAFNVADSCITVGAIGLLWLMLREERASQKRAQRVSS